MTYMIGENVVRKRRHITVVKNQIDYDKLAEAITKAQERNKIENEPTNKIGFVKGIWLIIINKMPQNGNKTAYILAELMACIFNFIAVSGIVLFFITCVSIFNLDWSISIDRVIVQVLIVVLILFLLLVISLVFRGIANEIKAEKDRNYITTLFFGFTSLASLIVALVAFFKGVG